MRFWHQLYNNDQFNRVYGTPESGLGYAAFPYFGSWNKYGPNPFGVTAFTPRSSLAYNPLGANFDSLAGFNFNGPIPDAFKVTFSNVKNRDLPFESGASPFCSSFNNEFILYRDTNAGMGGASLTYSTNPNFHNIFAPFISNVSATSTFAASFLTLVFGKGEDFENAEDNSLVNNPFLDDVTFDSGIVYAVVHAHRFQFTFAGVFTWTARNGLLYTPISGTYIRAGNIQPSGFKALETRIIADRGYNYDNFVGTCDFSTAQAIIEPVKDNFYDLKSTLMGFSNHLYEPKYDINRCGPWETSPDNFVSFDDNPLSKICGNGISHVGYEDEKYPEINGINASYPSAFLIRINDVVSSGDSPIHCIDANTFYATPKKLLASCFSRKYTLNYNSTSFDHTLSPTELFNTVPTGVYTKAIGSRYEWHPTPISSEGGWTNSTIEYTRLVDFANICDLGCARQDSDYYNGTEGRVCNNKIILDIVEYTNAQELGNIRVDALVQFGEFTLSSGFFYHDFYFRKTLCDDTTSNKCSEPHWRDSGNINSGVIDCYSMPTYSGGWSYKEWTPNRPSGVKYFAESNPRNIANFENVDIILEPSILHNPRTKSPCYICNYSGIPQTIVLEVIESGYTHNGPYAYTFDGRESLSWNSLNFTSPSFNCSAYTTDCKWTFGPESGVRVIGALHDGYVEEGTGVVPFNFGNSIGIEPPIEITTDTGSGIFTNCAQGGGGQSLSDCPACTLPIGNILNIGKVVDCNNTHEVTFSYQRYSGPATTIPIKFRLTFTDIVYDQLL